jgi:hypothetical protein
MKTGQDLAQGHVDGGPKGPVDDIWIVWIGHGEDGLGGVS